MPDSTPKKPEHVKVTMYLPPELHLALRHECVERKMTMGELVEEAFATRMRAVWKETKPR